MQGKHPLRKWLDHNGLSSTDLAWRSGVKADMIRYICRFRQASRWKVKALSDATGIPPLVFFFPEENIDFDVSGCRANNIHASITC